MMKILAIVALFFANGYTPEDFEETRVGDYVLYYGQREKISQDQSKINDVVDPLVTEKSYTIRKAVDNILKFKTGDVVKADKKTGLRHFRNGKLINNFKIIPQLTIIKIQPKCRVAPCPPIETKFIVYYLEAEKRFINFRFNTLLTSVNVYENPNSPNQSLAIAWKKSYKLKTN